VKPTRLKLSPFERFCYAAAAGIALLSIAALFGCADAPTAPKANPCIHIDTLWTDGKIVGTHTAYYSPPNCPRPT
jgi:hypothetical protein